MPNPVSKPIMLDETGRLIAAAIAALTIAGTTDHDQLINRDAENQHPISAITGLAELLPAAASALNQLADKAFVNSTVGTNTANYISDDGEPFASVADLENYTGTVTNNDYAFVTGTDEAGNTFFDRYKATVSGSSVSWAKEYRLNNSSFTAVQWAAVESGISSALVASYNAHVTNADIHVTAQQKTSWTNKQSTAISDPGGYYDTNTVESALQEAGAKNAAQDEDIGDLQDALDNTEELVFTLEDDTTVTLNVVVKAVS